MSKVNYEYAKNIAMQYEFKSEFKIKKPSVYKKCFMNGWLNDFVWLKRKQKWTYDKCKEYIKEHPNLKQRQYACYNSIYANKWFDLLPINKQKLTFEYCKSIESKYDNLSDFRKNDVTVYDKMKFNGWLSLTIKKYHKWENDENIIELAKTCKTRTELFHKSVHAYDSARKSGLLIKLFPTDARINYNKEHYINIAKTCNNRKELNEKNSNAYVYLLNNKLLNDIFPNNMKQEYISIAKKCKSKKELRIKYNKVYYYLVKHKLIDEIFSENIKKEYIEIAKTCKNKTELKKKYRKIYECVHNYKLLDEHYDKKHKHIEIAKSCESRDELKNKFYPSYRFLIKNKLLDDLLPNVRINKNN